MLFFLSVAFCAVLVTVFVIALRRHHQRAFTLATEREQSLPPLTDAALDIEQLMPEELDHDSRLDPDFFETSAPTDDTAADTGSVPSVTPPQADHGGPSTVLAAGPSLAAQPLLATESYPTSQEYDETATQHPAASDPELADPAPLEDTAPLNPTPSHPAPANQDAPSGDWKQRAMQWRDQADYEQALACCGEAWPQWQSYQQAAVIMRAAIKNAATDELVNDWYDRLYHLAVQASLLHDRIEGLPDLTRQQIAATFSRADLDALGMPWQDVGCDRLRLLTKSDRRSLIALYGPPADHKSAKSWFQHLL